MSSRIKAALVVALVFGAGTAVVAEGDEGKVAHGVKDHGLVLRRATPVRLFEGRDAGPNERFLRCVADNGCGRMQPCSTRG